MEFYCAEILAELRNRSYFESFTGNLPEGGKNFIRSEGAWRITIFNSGTTTATLSDGGGNKIILPPLPAGSTPDSNKLILDGHPAVTRDDEILIVFDGFGFSRLEIIYDRMVLKKEDNEYAVDTVMKEIKG